MRALALLLAFAAPFLGREAGAWTVEIQTPAFSQVRSPIATIESRPEDGHHALSFPDSVASAELEIPGPLGGLVSREVSEKDAGKILRIPTGILSDDDPDPSKIPHLPTLCPRVQPGSAGGDSAPPYLYRGEEDTLSRFPVIQLTDPDRHEGLQAESVRLFDRSNVLQLKSVRIRYDYEDENIIHRIPDGQGKDREVREGRGGFYANFHYAVLPYSEEILTLPEQTLLHLAQGSLKRIGQERFRPELRTHGFLPGPFLSRNSLGYALCEWGDTARQAPEQSLRYEGIALWDWDFPVSSPDRVLLIVWEGDEEDQARAQGLDLPDNYLLDDLVGVFEIPRASSLQALTLKNLRGDFEVTVQTGYLALPPAPALAGRP